MHYKIIVPCIALVFQLFLTGCKKEHDGIRVAIDGNIQNFDPLLANDEASVTAQGLIHETLYQPHYLSQPLRLIPWLAADFPFFEKDKGGERAVFSIIIRPDIYFHPRDCLPEKTQLTAESFVKSWNRFEKLDTLHPAKSNFLRLIEKWEIGEGNKLILTTTFSKKDAAKSKSSIQDQLVELLSLGFTAPIHENCSQSGTGPYVFTKQRTRVEYQFKKNTAYHPQFFPTSADPSFQQKEYLEDLGRHLPLNDGISLLIVDRPGDYWTLFSRQVLDISPLPWIVWSHHLRVLEPSGNWVMEPEKTVLGAKVNVENSANVVVLTLGNLTGFQSSESTKTREILVEYLQKRLKEVQLIPHEVERFASLPLEIKNVFEKTNSAKSKNKGLQNTPPQLGKILTIDIVGARKWQRQSASLIAQVLEKDGIKVEVRENSVENFSKKMNSGDYVLAIRPILVSNTEIETLKSEILKMPEAIVPLWLERGVWLSQPSILNFRSDTQIRNRFAFVRRDKDLETKTKDGE